MQSMIVLRLTMMQCPAGPMAAKVLWTADTAAAWTEVQQSLGSIWAENASSKLQELNRCVTGHASVVLECKQ